VIKKIEVFLPILLMVLVVGIHKHLVFNQKLSSHHGGGFAMFSSTDYSDWRTVRLMVENVDGKFYYIQPGQLDAERSVRIMPNSNNIENLILEIRKKVWILGKSNQLKVPTGFQIKDEKKLDSIKSINISVLTIAISSDFTEIKLNEIQKYERSF
jgi:hypothetical protein